MLPFYHTKMKAYGNVWHVVRTSNCSHFRAINAINNHFFLQTLSKPLWVSPARPFQYSPSLQSSNPTILQPSSHPRWDGGMRVAIESAAPEGWRACGTLEWKLLEWIPPHEYFLHEESRIGMESSTWEVFCRKFAGNRSHAHLCQNPEGWAR